MILSIEGNIGSGKSTIINFLRFLKSDNIIFVDEPVSEWQNIKSDNKNALELFYENQKDNSFWFQVLAYITRLKNLMQAIKDNPNKIIISERSIYTDKYIFAKMLYEKNYISDIEYKTYNYWFDTFKEITNVDVILYVNTNPEECMKRIIKRNRDEEVDKISLDYLIDCDKKHKDWINSSNSKVVTINGHQSIDNIKEFMKDFIDNLIV